MISSAPWPSSARAIGLACVFGIAAGCSGDNQDPGGADELLARVRASNYASWRRAPNLPARQPSFTAHAGAVDVYVNDVMAAAIADPSKMVRAAPASPPRWPKGSIVVKEGYSGDRLSIVAVMERRSDAEDGWYFAEYSGSGTALYSNKPAICVDCHKARASYSDWVFSLEQPR